MSAPERHPFVSDTLGLAGFPVGTEPSSDMGDHVMGAVVMGWLTRHPLERWGEAWARSGSLEARFRAHLNAGIALTTTVDGDADEIAATIADAAATVYATATAQRHPSVNVPSAPPPGAVSTTRARPRHDELHGRRFAPLTFEFDADRDLVFTERLSDGELWRTHRWAHPAWLASATNAIVRRAIDFGTDGAWRNAGLAVHHHRPIRHGETITLTGGIDELFDRPRHRFAVARMIACVDDEPVASLGNTFVYEALAE